MSFIIFFNYIESIIENPKISILARLIWIIASNVKYLISVGLPEKLYPLVVNTMVRISISRWIYSIDSFTKRMSCILTSAISYRACVAFSFEVSTKPC